MRYSILLAVLITTTAYGQDAVPARGTPRHELTLLTGLSRSGFVGQTLCGWAGCGESVPSHQLYVSTTLAYNYLRPLNTHWWLGGGVSYAFRSSPQPGTAALSALGEYRMGRNDQRLRPLGRLQAGVGLPVSSNLPLSDRRPGLLFHPAVGLQLSIGTRQRALITHLGYRFTDIRYQTVDWQGNPAARELTYRRLTLTLGYQF